MKKIIAAVSAGALSLALAGAMVPADASSKCGQQHRGGQKIADDVYFGSGGGASGGYFTVNDGQRGGNYIEIGGDAGGVGFDGKYEDQAEGGYYVGAGGVRDC